MPASLDLFRDQGIIPDTVRPAVGKVRAYFSWGHVIGQYIATCLMLGFGLGIGTLFAFTIPMPFNFLAAPVALALFGVAVYFVTRRDYAWVELDGRTIRAKHLYTRQVVERSVDDVEDLLTLVFQVNSLTTMLAEKIVGRVRGIQIRFRDGRTPLMVCRADPKMTNAKELIEAIVFCLWESGPVDAEVILLDGTPLIRRIYRT